MKLLKIAIRNTKRNVRRTAVTIVTIAIGVFVIIFAGGVVKGFQNETIVQMIETRTGDIQIHKTGYRETLDMLPLDLSIKFNDVLNGVSGIKGLKEISGRIFFSGKLATQEESAVLFGKAIDVAKEIAICPRVKDNMVIGEFLTPDDKNKIVLTKDLAERLKINIGDSLLLFATSQKGAINATELILKGVFHSTLPDSNKKLGYIPLKTAQELLLMDGMVTEVVLKKEKNYDINKIVGEMKNKFSAHGFEINTWRELEQVIIQMVERQGLLSIVVSVILFIIVFSTVMNTMLMVVLERTNEIGTLMAIGFKRIHILTLFVFEGTLKGFIGGTIGTVLGVIAVYIVNLRGIPLCKPGVEGVTFILRPEIDLKLIILALLFSVGAAVLASLYPANRGSKMNPVEALRSV
ncbi:MAG: ABC transporter permease [Deltaproteobacteria bacterium]|nr:ABC transporter permease [Deltaproteobacteria bacterium]